MGWLLCFIINDYFILHTYIHIYISTYRPIYLSIYIYTYIHLYIYIYIICIIYINVNDYIFHHLIRTNKDIVEPGHVAMVESGQPSFGGRTSGVYGPGRFGAGNRVWRGGVFFLTSVRLHCELNFFVWIKWVWHFGCFWLIFCLDRSYSLGYVIFFLYVL